MGNTEFILASASPRRKELLGIFGVDFEVVESDFDESTLKYDGENSGLYVRELALLKANSVAAKIKGRGEALIIAADTVVCAQNKILGKPQNKADAFKMLKMLSGTVHEVRTGVCVYRLSDAMSVSADAVTRVKFKELTDDKINAYINTGEPMDKAGSYGIQGIGSVLIDEIHGDYFNVVGLPLSLLADILEKEYNVTLF